MELMLFHECCQRAKRQQLAVPPDPRMKAFQNSHHDRGDSLPSKLETPAFLPNCVCAHRNKTQPQHSRCSGTSRPGTEATQSNLVAGREQRSLRPPEGSKTLPRSAEMISPGNNLQTNNIFRCGAVRCPPPNSHNDDRHPPPTSDF